ncbi:methyltransferase domain-containing protein [Streptomyces sp. NPDC002734]|uniref:class I SAM-dependent methyltransferase n=1 Tax=Streptomyces sp. NPDC002734 TaxID=3154426 RepID=UPI00333370E6
MSEHRTSPYDRDHVREFFAARATGWDRKFPDDGPAFAAVVAVLGLRPGDRVLDAGCGTGRALPALRAAVGPSGVVLGLDLTEEMLRTAARAGRGREAALVLADAAAPPVRSGALDAVFASGLIAHLPDPGLDLAALARTVRAGGVLALFHPVGRAALAARQGRELDAGDLRAAENLRPLLDAAGWRLTAYVDEPARFLALAVRTGG